MNNWYIKRDNKQAGPFDSSRLKVLATEGKIKPDDLVRREDQEIWHKASKLKGLFGPSPESSNIAQQQKSPTSPATVPPEITSIHEVEGQWNITESQVKVAKALKFVLIASLLAMVFGSFLSNRHISSNEESADIYLLISIFAVSVGTLLWYISDSILLFLSLRALPASKRLFKIHPAILVGLTFLPILNFVAFFLIYGLLGTTWVEQADKTSMQSKQGEYKVLRWSGYALAVCLFVSGLMTWFSIMASAAEVDISWWTSPLSGSQPKKSFRKNPLSYLSPEDFLILVLAFCYQAFYYPQFQIWRGVTESIEDGEISK